ncbi:MAG: apolipoprotein N-acyltransferase [Planctomycetia bacterium]
MSIPFVCRQDDGSSLDGRRLWFLALAGAMAMFLAQPPADLWPLAWLAPVPWLAIIVPSTLASPRPWRALWTAGFVHWLLTIHWLRLPHPATAIGWVALSAYLACFVPLFIWVARTLLHRWRWPLVAAAPLAWISCEQLRGSLLGGFTFGGLGHTQWRWTTFVQAADLFGAVGVSGVVMLVAAAVGSRSARQAAVAATVVAATLGYGAWRLAGEPSPVGTPLDVLLVQGSIDTELKHDPAAAGDVANQYDELTIAGLKATPHETPDLIVWPETMWRWGLLAIDPDEHLPEDVVERMVGPRGERTGPSVDDERQRLSREALEAERLAALAVFARRYGTHWLVGVDRQEITPRAPSGAFHYNCGLFLDADGVPMARYDKMHPVMFGEYIPLANRFPWLYSLTPLPAGLTAGTHPVAVPIAGHRAAATICYETALPDAVRSMVRRLAGAGSRPDVIVNLTNDGWFWGSSELDMHLTAAVFRAIEVRTPLVIAANTGFSAWIDGCGRLLACGPRRSTATLRARVRPDGRPTAWLAWGSLPNWGCVAVAACIMIWDRRRVVGASRHMG